MPVAGTQTSSADSGLGGSVGRRIRRPDLEIVSERRHGSKAGYSSGWLGSTPEGRRPQIRGLRAGGSLAIASSTPATQPESKAPTTLSGCRRAGGPFCAASSGHGSNPGFFRQHSNPGFFRQQYEPSPCLDGRFSHSLWALAPLKRPVIEEECCPDQGSWPKHCAIERFSLG